MRGSPAAGDRGGSAGDRDSEAVAAAALHLSRGEVRETGLNAALIALAAVTAWLATTW
ncbi:hypothetical protein [Streptomyces sp. NPDC001743]|uniref:hypothetical protein n=1 Tax=Streptomyces sp. NPDC001743 TaxID=3154397 RepID=UPI003333CE7F